MTLGEKLTELRKEANLKQYELAEKLNISSKHLSEFENNKKHPNWNMLIKILKKLNATIVIEHRKTIIERTTIDLNS